MAPAGQPGASRAASPAAPEQSIERADCDAKSETTADGNVDTSRRGARNDHHNRVSPSSSNEPRPAASARCTSQRGERKQTVGRGRRQPEDNEADQADEPETNKPKPVFLQGTPATTNSRQQQQQKQARPLILITEPNESGAHLPGMQPPDGPRAMPPPPPLSPSTSTSQAGGSYKRGGAALANEEPVKPAGDEGDKFEVIDGISYRIVAAVTKRPDNKRAGAQPPDGEQQREQQQQQQQRRRPPAATSGQDEMAPHAARHSRFKSVRRKSSAFVANLLHNSGGLFVPSSRSSHALSEQQQQQQNPRRLSIYELTKSPPPETSIEMYLNDRRRSSTVSAKFVQQQLEQQSTFESNYSARQQYFRDLNAKLIKPEKKNLLNVVANRGQIHRHSVDIAQLPLFLAQSAHLGAGPAEAQSAGGREILEEADEDQDDEGGNSAAAAAAAAASRTLSGPINQARDANIIEDQQQQREQELHEGANPQTAAAAAAAFRAKQLRQLASISEAKAGQQTEAQERQQRDSLGQLSQLSSDKRQRQRRLASQSSQSGQTNLIVRRFQKFDASALSCAPSPDVKIGQRVAYKEYYGNEFGTIRWIGRVPQISPDWTVGVEFDNAIGEGDGSLNGRRYFIAKDCFAKFLPLAAVALVDQHVGRPEPGTMISVMSAAVRPGQMISIQRVSTVHVQHCFLNAPHQRPGAEFLAVNTRLHCQCPNCGPCAHVVKPPRTQRLLTPKNATHMCQFSTYTCCGMESSDEALCTYTGNKISSLPLPPDLSGAHYGRGPSAGPPPPPLGNSWMEGSGYLSQLQAEQQKLMPEEYRLGAAPDDTLANALLRRTSSGRRRPRNRQEGVSPDPRLYSHPSTPINNNNNNQQQACDHPFDTEPALHSRPDASPSRHAHQEHLNHHQHNNNNTNDDDDNNNHRRRHHHRHRHKHRRKHDHNNRPHQYGRSPATPDGPGSVPAAAALGAGVVSPVYANLVVVAGEPIEMQSSCGAGNPNSAVAQRRNEFQEAMRGPPKAADNNGNDHRLGGGEPVSGLQNGSRGTKLNDSPVRVVSGADNSTRAEFADAERRRRLPLESQETSTSEQFDYELAAAARDVNEVDVKVVDGESRQLVQPAPMGIAKAGVEHEDENEDGDEPRRPAVVQYRDSIENRYLFPTDDIIDSTLEADLETLSQARYGRPACSSVSNCSSEENFRRRWPAIRLARKRWQRNRRLGRAEKKARRQSGASPAEPQDGNQADNQWYNQRAPRERSKRAGRRSSSGARRRRGRGHSGRNKTPPGGRELARARGREHDGGDYEQVFSDDEDDGGSYHRHRYSTSRNTILKGLRSLVVSCLSANEQRQRASVCSTPNCSRLNHCRHQACGGRRQQGRQHTSGWHSAHDGSASAISERCRSAGCRCGEIAKPSLAKDCDENPGGGGGGCGLLVQANSEAMLAGQLEQLQVGKAHTAAAFISCPDSPRANELQLEAGANHHYMNLDHPARCHRREDKTNSGPDCGGPALIEWRCCQMANWSNQLQFQQQHQQQQQQRQTGKRAAAWLQISSSSDCGFSSASQNSMNLTTNNSNRSSNDSNSHAEEQRRLVAVYRRLATRLTGSLDSHSSRPEWGAETGGGGGGGEEEGEDDDDLLRLRRALVELHSEACAACRAHTNCNCPQLKRGSPPPPPPPPTNGEAEQFDDAHANRQETKEGTSTAATIQQVGPTACDGPAGLRADQSDELQKTLTRPFELKLTLSLTPDPMGQNFAAQSNCGIKLSAGADQAGC